MINGSYGPLPLLIHIDIIIISINRPSLGEGGGSDNQQKAVRNCRENDSSAQRRMHYGGRGTKREICPSIC